jgi:dTDP-4-amino-4,6-dideoxygalactose transaminase
MLGRRPPLTRRVVDSLAERYGARRVVPTDSGTAALTLALRAAARRHPGPAALPAYCCFDIATAADGAGVPVLLYDVDPLTLGPKFASLQRALVRGARTIVVAHLYGVPVDLERVARLAEDYGALVIEDAAQGAGARFGERAAGGLGTFGVLSFGRGKGITGGGGGALLVNAAAVEGDVEAEADAVAVGRTPRGWRALVTSAAQWALARPAIYGLPASVPFLGLGETTYRSVEPIGPPTAFSLGVLSRTLRLAEAEAAVRRRNATRLLHVLAAMAQPHLAAVRGTAQATPGWLRLPVVATADPTVRLLAEGAGALGIMPGYPRSLADLDGFRERIGNPADDFAGARLLATHLLTLPTHSRLGDADLQALETWLRRSA